MKLNIALASTAVTFEFDTPRDRDTFWKGMEKCGFLSQGAAERLGTRGINITTAKIRTGYAWPFEALPGSANGNVAVRQVEKKAEAPAAPANETLTQVAEPPPAIPVPEIVEVPPQAYPVVAETSSAIMMPSKTMTTVLPVVPAPPADPEPTDRRTREWRTWKARQK